LNKKNEVQVLNDMIKSIKLGNEISFEKRKKKVPLAIPSYGYEEIIEVVDSLISSQITMGKKVKQFENEFAKYIGTKYAIMVNSGSSANLLALSILSNPKLENPIKPGDEIIVPAVCWSTTISPIVQIGAIPVVVDVELDSFNIDQTKIKESISSKTKAIMPVHLLGRPCNMDAIIKIANSNELYVLEDSCEAHGAEFKDRKVGSFGDLSTFSFYVSHHITTIEGGMICTNSETYYELAKTLRAHGWIREISNKDEFQTNYPDIDSRFLFANLGFNFRPTEIQGSFGIHQIKKIEKFIKIREHNTNYWNSRLEPHSDYFIIPSKDPNTRTTWFAYPITLRSKVPFERKELIEFLERKGIETRDVMSGNITAHPMFKLIHFRISTNLPNADYLAHRSFLIGNHQGIGKREREYVADCIDEFIATI
jgi:CDP-6-deoxy-D-xylo-4-hexulose-3-dehydrase|tara:strand:- start:940 stop:2211 length:1272 start_codon:yes stop_codon:yes gene_type:complete